ncbi:MULTISPECIES: LysR family transcriptional regulator [unclassified Leucobacter]|uniref:LysR family transcriptional regulator n=1 Tax=unclassified Leucobacter TaxID=2621730 RepID=UPI000A07CB84|nr:LysR family transcriptional regulator [Leucobacter sp. Ag1]
MEWTLRELRCFVTVADAGSFTEGAARLFVSQAAVSRTIAGLERGLGAQLLRRLPSGCTPTPAGWELLPAARRVLAEADRFTEFAGSRREVLRVGYAWAALGVHTARLLRDWPVEELGAELEFERVEIADRSLIEGRCDIAIMRRRPADPGLESAEIGRERRMVAFAEDDAEWGRRRQLTLDEISRRTVIVDVRSGTTDAGLWAGGAVPAFLESSSVDQWLDLIAAGRGVGITAEATSHHHRRDGVRYRGISDVETVPVLLVWRRGERDPAVDALVGRARALYASGSEAATPGRGTRPAEAAARPDASPRWSASPGHRRR